MVEAWYDSPGNTGEPKNIPKIGALQNACSKFISRPQARSSYKLVSYRLIGLEICLTCTYPTSPGNTAILFPSPRSFGSTQSSRGFLPNLPQHSLTMFFHKVSSYLFWLVNLVVSCQFFTHQWWNPKSFGEENLVPRHCRMSIPSFALPEKNPKQRYRMTGPDVIL